MYDIGVYFEANGHGTVVFSDNAKTKLKEGSKNDRLVSIYKKFVVVFEMRLNSSFSENQRQACNKLLTLIDVINETVGDAIADMLLVETILHAKGWDIQDWEQCYTDLPNRLVKVKVKVCMSLLFYCFVFIYFPLNCFFIFF